MALVDQHTGTFGVVPTCEALNVSRASYYRWKQRPEEPLPSNRCPPRKLTEQEETMVLEVLNSDRFMDQAVPEVHATLLDEGRYLCSERTMYRILERHEQATQRRHQREHPVYQKPELLATGPNQLWSWDITRIKGPKPWIFYHLYVVIDVFSRYVVAWCISEHESGEQARALIEAACQRQVIGDGELVVHSDRGKAMRSKTLADLLGELGVQRSFSRPHVSNDNPYSESQFKTLKYRPDFPNRFGSIEDARNYLRSFFKWYNTEHRHSGVGMMTPLSIHTGEAEHIYEERRRTLQEAYRRHPERFVKGQPKPKDLPTEVWINKPEQAAA
jgi:putative transposase